MLNVNIRKQLKHFELQTTFSCRVGELTAVVGPSGAGKSTLVRLIAGLDMPDQGTIALDSVLWTDTVTGRFVPTHKRKIGLVFQEFPLFPHLTVRQNIGFGAPDNKKLGPLMETFRISHLADSRPGAISGGEKQRTAFCQALARQPDLLLLDEPFSALDVETRSFLCSLLADLKPQLGIPIIHVTHDLDEAEWLGNTIVALDKGRIAPEWLHRQNLNQPVFAPSVTPV